MERRSPRKQIRQYRRRWVLAARHRPNATARPCRPPPHLRHEHIKRRLHEPAVGVRCERFGCWDCRGHGAVQHSPGRALQAVPICPRDAHDWNRGHIGSLPRRCCCSSAWRTWLRATHGRDHSILGAPKWLPAPSCYSSGSPVVLYKLVNGGHTWPGKRPYLPERIIGKTGQDIDGTRAIRHFFRSLPPR